MNKKELIQIRVTEEQKKAIKQLATKKKLTISELVLYSLMKQISEDNITNNQKELE